MSRRLAPAVVIAVLALATLGPGRAAGQVPGLTPPKKAPAAAAPGAAPATPAERREMMLVQALRERGGWETARERITAKIVDFVPALAAALIILLVFYVLYRASARLLHGLLRRTRADPAVQAIGMRLTKSVLLALGVVMAASQLGFQVGSVLAGLGIVGLAVGLAAQDSLANLVAGITILWDHPFRIGDHVTIAGIYGQVKDIGLRTTRLVTVDRIDAILPNKDVINEKILNHTLTPQLRLGVPVGIGYGEDVGEARRVLLAAVEGHRLILADPAPKVVVTELGESAVNLELRVWLRDPHAERETLFEMLELAKAALDGAGIEIPFPQRVVRLVGPEPGAPVPATEPSGGEPA